MPLTAAQPEFEDDYQPTGLERLIGPVAPPPEWDDCPPEETPEAVEWMRRRDWAEAVREQIERDKRADERAASMVERSAIVTAAKAGDYAALAKITGKPAGWMPAPANDNRKAAVTATPFVWIDPKTIPRREWLYGGHYARQYLSATFGAGGGGKTAHSYTEALAMASGKPLLGEIPRERRRVWTINLEDPIEEIQRRVMAAALHFSLRPDDIEGHLWTDSGREQQFVVARTEGRDIKVVEPIVSSLIREVKERQIDVLIVDPFVSTHSVPENDNGAIQAVAAQWVRVAHEANCSVELVHHVRKSNGQEATADDGRGAGALKDKARSVRVVNGMTKEEADKAGVSSEDVRRYFRVDFGKVNMVASSSSAWRRFASVSLGNGAGMLDPADQIGVVEEWRWPSAQDIAGDVPEEALRGILGRLAGGDAREHEQAAGWAGNVIAELLGIDIDDKAGRTRVKSLLRAWLKSGVLKVHERLDHKRMMRKFIVPASAPPHANSGGAEVGQGEAASIPSTCLTTPPPRRGVGVGKGEWTKSQVGRWVGQIRRSKKTSPRPPSSKRAEHRPSSFQSGDPHDHYRPISIPSPYRRNAGRLSPSPRPAARRGCGKRQRARFPPGTAASAAASGSRG